MHVVDESFRPLVNRSLIPRNNPPPLRRMRETRRHLNIHILLLRISFFASSVSVCGT